MPQKAEIARARKIPPRKKGTPQQTHPRTTTLVAFVYPLILYKIFVRVWDAGSAFLANALNSYEALRWNLHDDCVALIFPQCSAIVSNTRS
jgi:hypothetical protein